jgi:hypothetical protein
MLIDLAWVGVAWLGVDRQARQRLASFLWLIPAMPFYRMIVFWFRIAGFLHAVAEPGTWRVRVEAREVYKTDLFRLYLQMESATATSSQFDIISQQPVADSTSGTGDDTPPPYTLWIPIVP